MVMSRLGVVATMVVVAVVIVMVAVAVVAVVVVVVVVVIVVVKVVVGQPTSPGWQSDGPSHFLPNLAVGTSTL